VLDANASQLRIPVNILGGSATRTSSAIIHDPIQTPSLDIDPRSLATTSTTPTITGTSNLDPGTATVRIAVSIHGNSIYGSGLYGLANNGRWSIPIIPNLSPGAYTISVYDNYNDLRTTGTLIISR
jgi:hypothetical protein